MKELFKAINNAWYDQMGIVNPDIVDFCFDNGFYSWKDTIDGDRNIVDSEKVITRKDLQDCCNAIGIDFDCLSF